MPFDPTPLPWQATVLLDALEYMRRWGWNPTGQHDSTGRVCIYHAIRAVGYHRNIEELGIPWPADFNDALGRTFEEVEQWMQEQISNVIHRA